MGFENRHIFKGVINGKNLNNYTKLNYKIKDLKSRKVIVDEILNKDIDEYGRNFFEVYFDEHYKSEANKCDELSEKNNVCKILENMANYLLGSKEIREDRKNDKQQYKFYINKEEFNLRTKKEDFLENMVPSETGTNSNNNCHDAIIHFLVKNKKNNKKIKTQAITTKNLKEDSYCGEVLRDYNRIYKVITNELINPKEFNGKRYKLTKLKKDLFYDMIYCKDHLKGVFGYKPKNLLPDNTKPNWDAFDWKNPTHVKELIYLQVAFNPEKEISFLIMDLEILIDKMNRNNLLTKKELKTYQLIRLGYKNIEISKISKVNKSRISLQVNTIVDKICKSAKNKIIKK